MRGRFFVVMLVSCTAITGLDKLSVDDEPPIGLPDGSSGTVENGDGGTADDGSPSDLDGAADAPFDSGVCDEPGLVAWWRFDEGAGEMVRDCTSNGLDGKLEGGVWTTGKHGGAIELAGNGFVGFGNPAKLAGTGAFTAMAWVRDEKTDANITQYIVGKTSAAGLKGWRLATEPPAFSISVSGDGSIETLGGTVTNGAWIHVAMVYIPDTAVELYVDGVRLVRDTNNKPPSLVGSTDEVRIGDRTPPPDASTGGFPFHGAIDDVRIYDRALSEAEIAERAKP